MERILEDNGSVTYRFQCDCLTPQHAIDVEVQKGNDVTIYFHSIPTDFRSRLRWCWRMLSKGIGYEHDMVLREYDVPELARILKEAGDATE